MPRPKGRNRRRHKPVVKRQESEDNIDVVDGLSPGIGFTRETACYRRPLPPKWSRTFPPLGGAAVDVGTDAVDNAAMMNKHMSFPSLSTDMDIENDGLKAITQTTKKLSACPFSRPKTFINEAPSESPAQISGWFFPRREKPDICTRLLVSHDMQTDTPTGDYFGAYLATYHEHNPSYYRHFLCEKVKGGIADQIKFLDYDELVLLDDLFVPDQTHEELVNLFHNLKVDSHTKTSFVFRRSLTKQKQWQWYMTSAVLCPLDPITGNHIEKEEFAPLTNNQFIKTEQVRLKCQSENFYIDITDTTITAGPLKNDPSKNMSKRIQMTITYYDDKDRATFRSKIQGTIGRCPYVAVDENCKLRLQEGEFWYGYSTIGKRLCFNCRDVYLGYSHHSRDIVASKEKQFFEKFTWHPFAYDELDGCPTSVPRLSQSYGSPLCSPNSSFRSFTSSGFLSESFDSSGSQSDPHGSLLSRTSTSDYDSMTYHSPSGVITRSSYRRMNSLKTPTSPMEALSFSDTLTCTNL